MTNKERKTFLLTYTKKMQVKRRTVQPALGQPSYRRQNSLSYYLKDEDGNIIEVCKENFTSTLGYCTNNDRVIRTVLKAENNALMPLDDRRGSHTPANKLDKSIVIDHINSFAPSIAHYRREHAPLRLYLPTDLNANIMYKHFQNIYGETWCSYDYYRTTLRDLNISFVKLGHEDCFVCEKSDLHFKSTDHKKNSLNEICVDCKQYERHILKAQQAREQYKADGAAANANGKPVFSGDLQKVIMLPRFESLKDVIFAQRLVAFHETFAPVGTKSKRKPLAILWHEAITGRSRVDIISTFYRFFLHNRDEPDIVLWLDNCSAQNKNWALYSMFAYVVNCKELSLDKLQVKYFEPGHTFMSADAFHHQVEKSLKEKHKVLDFNDFIECVKKSNSGKVDVAEMKLHDFLNWKDLASQYKITRATPRPYLKDIVYIEFNRGSLNMKYKQNFADELLIEVSFLTKKAEREKLSLPEPKTNPRGFPSLRKKSILENLSPIIPSSRLIFWQQLPEVEELGEDEED
ncbi:uncharacterized protein LOC116180454 isoform X2 [Photinus pyralis]|nr:uncharacterized protein LOC116180454 isoform X2 [Photinus pyralis]